MSVAHDKLLGAGVSTVSAVFVDTSAIYALMVVEDARHEDTKAILGTLTAENAALVSTSFVQCTSLWRSCSRVSASAPSESSRNASCRHWRSTGLAPRPAPARWLPCSPHTRSISLTDWTSFGVMRERRIEQAFAFDPHFAEQGFHVLAPQI